MEAQVPCNQTGALCGERTGQIEENARYERGRQKQGGYGH